MSSQVRIAQGGRIVRRFTLSALVALASVPSLASARTLLVLAPHPDDEALMASGVVRSGIARGDRVKMVIVTNGDAAGTSAGYVRQGESVAAAQLLGLVEDDVIFLGYGGDLLNALWWDWSGTQVFTSNAGVSSTYGNRGLGRKDYHRYLYGTAGRYTRNTLLGDLRALLTNFQPDEVYTVSNWDAHPDHQHARLFLAEALIAVTRAGSLPPVTVYETLIWDPATNWSQTAWPCIGGFTPLLPVPEPSSLSETHLEWSRLHRFPVPPEMLATNPSANLKARAIEAYATQVDAHLRCYAHRDEIFWRSDFGSNLAFTAQVTASSEIWWPQGAAKAVNGIVDGDPHDWIAEWVSSEERAGAWIRLDWTAPVRVGQINLYDRPDTGENVLAGTLTFSDGTSVAVGALPPDGRVRPVIVTPRTVTWVRFTVNGATGRAAGLAEIEVLGKPAASTANLAPHFVSGPVVSPGRIRSSQTAQVSVAVNDLDGDLIQVSWSSDAGSVQGTGMSAVFTPPPVSAQSIVGITADLSDGRGGTARNVAFVTVDPSPDGFTVAPSRVAGGDAAQGTVFLADPAPTGGVQVAISVSHPAVATAPASLSVPAGQKFDSFPIQTGPVTSTVTVVFTAALPGGPRSASLTVTPPPSVAGLSVNPASLLGGQRSVGTVVLDAPAGSGGLGVSLFTSDSTVTALPPMVTVPAGASSASFDIETVAVSTTTQVLLTASAGPAFATAVLTVNPLVLVAFEVSPAAVRGGSPFQGTVTLNGDAAGGATIGLSSGDPGVVTIPLGVAIAPGTRSATFGGETAPVGAPTSVPLTASFGPSSLTAVIAVTVDSANPNLLPGAVFSVPPWDAWGNVQNWTRVGGQVDPAGGLSAVRFSRSDSRNDAQVHQNVSGLAPGDPYTFSFYARRSGTNGRSGLAVIRTDWWSTVEGGAPMEYSAILDQPSGIHDLCDHRCDGQNLPDGWHRVAATFTVPSNLGGAQIGIYVLGDVGPTDVTFWGCKLEAGSEATGTPSGLE